MVFTAETDEERKQAEKEWAERCAAHCAEMASLRERRAMIQPPAPVWITAFQYLDGFYSGQIVGFDDLGELTLAIADPVRIKAGDAIADGTKLARARGYTVGPKP
jgi:hypothetical protein